MKFSNVSKVHFEVRHAASDNTVIQTKMSFSFKTTTKIHTEIKLSKVKWSLLFQHISKEIFLNEMKHDPVMNPKQILHECVANVFLSKYKHKEPHGRRETVFLSSGNSYNTKHHWKIRNHLCKLQTVKSLLPLIGRLSGDREKNQPDFSVVCTHL